MNKNTFIKGMKDGIPIGLGYLSVSFTFGIIAVSYGFKWWQAVLISMMTVTSAGQFAGIGIMTNPCHYMEMLISQLTINVRYSFMSISLSQKVSKRFKGPVRWLLGFTMTDEIFAVASQRKEVTPSYFAGLSLIPYLGWALGTLTGALLGNVLPHRLMSCLGVAIYGMFVAIVIPETKKSKAVITVVVVAMILSAMFYYLPFLKEISTGIAISICAIVAACMGAVFFPVSDRDEEDNG